MPCVRLSVRPSVTSRSSTKTAERRITQTTSHDSPGTLVFWKPKIYAKFERGHPLWRRIARSLGDSWASCIAGSAPVVGMLEVARYGTQHSDADTARRATLARRWRRLASPFRQWACSWVMLLFAGIIRTSSWPRSGSSSSNYEDPCVVLYWFPTDAVS